MNIFQVLLTQPLANGLIFFYKILGQNMGLAIIGFSLFLKVVLNPLSKPYMESMKKMREFAPQLEKLKKRHKGDRQKLLQAQAEFYKEKGINPGAGCLPQILQIIILIAFLNVFMSALRANGDAVTKFNELLYEPLKFTEGQTINTKFLYLDITQPDVFKVSFLPLPIPGIILILAAITQMLSAKMTSPYVEVEKEVAKKTESQSDDFQAAFQRSAIYTFPVLTIIFGISFPSGLALYWFVYSLFQLISQYRASGWGGLTSWLKRAGLLKYAKQNG